MECYLFVLWWRTKVQNHTTGSSLSSLPFHTYHLYYWRLCLFVLSCFRRVRLFVTLWTVAHQAPLSMGFSRKEYWSGLPCPLPGNLPYPGIEPASLMSIQNWQVFFFFFFFFFTTRTTSETLLKARNPQIVYGSLKGQEWFLFMLISLIPEFVKDFLLERSSYSHSQLVYLLTYVLGSVS